MSPFSSKQHPGLTPVSLLMLCLVLVGCSSPFSPSSRSGGTPDSLVGYWRLIGPNDSGGTKFLKIDRAGDAYTLDAPPLGKERLVVEGDRLVLQEVWKGKKFDSCVFSPVSGNDNELVWAAYTQYGQIFRLRWQRAEGSEAALAEELRRWAANNIIDGMVGSLVSHVDRWAFERRPSPVSNVRRYPPRSALLPGGTFWKWKEAPHFENPITGGRMVLGPGAGNLDYWVNANRNEFKVIGHLYGGGETSQGEYSAP